MLRFFARWWAKRKYIFNAELEAATNDLHASLSAQRATDAREMIAQANKEDHWQEPGLAPGFLWLSAVAQYYKIICDMIPRRELRVASQTAMKQ